MVPHRSALIAVALMLLCAASATAAPPRSEDARISEADELLADAAGYERAISLYREVLNDRPDAGEVRLRLARVLAWSRRYDESLAEFDRLLEQSEPPASARVERAEVLSWSGRLDEAEREFESLLEADPQDARAARGLARVELWSGRLGRAEKSYARALSLERDTEAEAEFRHLRAGWQPWVRPGFAWAADSEDFEWLRGEIEAAFYRTATTTLRARTGYHRVAHPQDDVPPAVRASHSSDQAAELALGAERLFDTSWLSAPLRIDLESGVRLWQHADETVFARGLLEATPWEATSVGLEARTGDHLDESASFEALEKRLRASGGSVSLWKGLGSAWEVYGRYGLAWVDDGNRRHVADASLSFRPFASRQTRLDLGASWMRYDHRSLAYYDPSSDVGLMLRATDRLGLFEGLTFAPSAGIGFGAADDEGHSSGVAYELTGELAYTRSNWHVALFGGRSQSRRARSYTWDHLMLRVTREFSL